MAYGATAMAIILYFPKLAGLLFAIFMVLVLLLAVVG